jgi:hypothetical protein
MYFTLSQTQYMILAVLGGVLLVIVLVVGYWSFRLSLSRKREGDKIADIESFPDGLKEGRQPLPLFITLLILAILIWGVAYVVAVSIGVLNVQ